MKDAGAAGAGTAWTAGAQGQGSRPQAVIRARRGEVSGHKTLLSSMHRAAEGPLCCAGGRGLAMRRRGPQLPRVHAPAGYGIGAALQITALVSGTGSILHDSPERSESEFARAVVMGRGGRVVLTSGR